MSQKHEGNKRSFIIYREQMFRLLAAEMSAHDKLAVELPCLMGFRAKEVATWRAEYIDWEHGDTFVMDAKKHKLFLVPLNRSVARHAMQVLNGRREGYVIQNTSSAWRGRAEKALSPIAIWYIWNKHTERLGLLNAEDISPITGRRFFAASWYHWLHLPLTTLSLIMRHADAKITLDYVMKLVFYEDLRMDFEKFEQGIAESEAEKVFAEHMPCA